jgi:5'-deoxynucleotidase YfbR-like HD superfamily hydrolase
VSPGLHAELSDLKRVRDARAPGSLAERLFRRAWSALVAGEAPRDVALRETARAVAATRLAGVDAAVLREGGLGEDDVAEVLRRALGEHATPELEAALLGPEGPAGPVPGFVDLLARQPRAGATAPGRARLVLEPAENHAEHCAIVAVGAVLLAPEEGADPGAVFLGALSHHLHNAFLPDSGFAGEVLLGEHLGPLADRFTARALDELPAALRAQVGPVLGLNARLDSPEARAVVAADVLDRVLQMRWHAEQAGFTLDRALDDLELVHPGPLQDFGLRVVEQAGLR